MVYDRYNPCIYFVLSYMIESVVKKIHDKIIKIINNEKKKLYNSMKDKSIISKTEKMNLCKLFNNCNQVYNFFLIFLPKYRAAAANIAPTV